MERAVNSRKKSSMTMIVEGREVALHFSDEPNTQFLARSTGVSGDLSGGEGIILSFSWLFQ